MSREGRPAETVGRGSCRRWRACLRSRSKSPNEQTAERELYLPLCFSGVRVCAPFRFFQSESVSCSVVSDSSQPHGL